MPLRAVLETAIWRLATTADEGMKPITTLQDASAGRSLGQVLLTTLKSPAPPGSATEMFLTGPGPPFSTVSAAGTAAAPIAVAPNAI